MKTKTISLMDGSSMGYGAEGSDQFNAGYELRQIHEQEEKQSQHTLNDYITNKARSNLTRFVLDKGARLAKDLGFSYVETDQAPESYGDLVEAYKHSALTRSPLPVFAGASEDTIYTSKEGNWAFRFWHDVTHVSNGLGFSLIDEVKCSSIQAEQVEKYFGSNALEYQLFLADTIGQSIYAEIHGDFPKDQLAYVKSLMRAY